VFCTYVPVKASDERYGAIEVSEPLTHQQRYVQATVVRTVLTTGVMSLVAVVLAFVVGSWVVGRPVRALEAKARSVGDGHLDTPLELNRRDELGGLAAELNSMCDRLAEARNRVEAETSARIATLTQLRHADRPRARHSSERGSGPRRHDQERRSHRRRGPGFGPDHQGTS
jgi:two-component system NtrC family sensor kinase